VLTVPAPLLAMLVAHCVGAQPHEGCGLLLGDDDGTVVDVVPVRNAASSSLIYEVDAVDLLRADREARARDLDVIGAFHSHTHTDAWPSATDVAKAVDPSWHWVIVSLRRADPVVRSFRIEDGAVREESVVVPAVTQPAE
jgi:[CysO sulfur-carrier protein]-S-L-cysteine hydrolase